MKKMLVLFVCLSFLFSCATIPSALGESAPSPLTWDEFWKAYNAEYQSTCALLGINTADIDIRMETLDDGNVGFVMSHLGSLIRGNIWADTSVIKQILLQVPKISDNSLDAAIPLMCMQHAICKTDADLNKIKSAKKYPLTVNGYSYKLESLNIGGYSVLATVTRVDETRPELKDVPNGKAFDIDAFNASLASLSALVFTPGEYVVGTHIAAGEYSVKPVNKSALLFVYRGDKLQISESLNPDDGDEIGRIVLKEYDVINISSGKLEFVPLK